MKGSDASLISVFRLAGSAGSLGFVEFFEKAQELVRNAFLLDGRIQRLQLLANDAVRILLPVQTIQAFSNMLMRHFLVTLRFIFPVEMRHDKKSSMALEPFLTSFVISET